MFDPLFTRGGHVVKLGEERMGNKHTVIWRGEAVGELRDAGPDMWYLDGAWLPSANETAQEFDLLARGFDKRQVMDDPTKGTRVVLCDQDIPDDHGTDALVISIYDDRLFVRRVLNEDAVAWLKKNVR